MQDGMNLPQHFLPLNVQMEQGTAPKAGNVDGGPKCENGQIMTETQAMDCTGAMARLEYAQDIMDIMENQGLLDDFLEGVQNDSEEELSPEEHAANHLLESGEKFGRAEIKLFKHVGKESNDDDLKQAAQAAVKTLGKARRKSFFSKLKNVLIGVLFPPAIPFMIAHHIESAPKK